MSRFIAILIALVLFAGVASASSFEAVVVGLNVVEVDGETVLKVDVVDQYVEGYAFYVDADEDISIWDEIEVMWDNGITDYVGCPSF